MPAPSEVIALLYRHEISCGLESDWNNGFCCWIGNSYSGHTAEVGTMTDMEGIAEWFDREAKRSLSKVVAEARIPAEYLAAYERDSDQLFDRH
jgi:hypothetical protein